VRVKHASSTQLHNYRSPEKRDEIIRRIALNPADVCVIGGDFNPNLVSSIRSLGPIAEAMPVVYVPGNLDFYSHRDLMEGLLERAGELAGRMGNVHLLSNSSVVLGDTKFIGATLWTDATEASQEEAARINDYRAITTLDGRWDIEKQKREHDATVDFLESELALSDGLNTVVVTHNSPHPIARDHRYPEPSPFFNVDLGHILEGPFAPDYWVVGGSHTTEEWEIGRTLVLANGLGHPMRGDVPENHERFNFDAVFETGLRPGPRFRGFGPGR
jgi:hypothetical protein